MDGEKPVPGKPAGNDESDVERRRAAVKKILAAGSVASGTGVVASLHWKTPVIEAVVLPVHAQTTPSSISGQIGTNPNASLLDLFMSPAFAGNGVQPGLVGGCIELSVVGTSVTVTVTLNNGVSDTESGSLSGTSFTIYNVNGYTVTGAVDSATSPSRCEGFVGPVEFSAVLGGTCTVLSTTTACVPNGTPCPPI